MAELIHNHERSRLGRLAVAAIAAAIVAAGCGGEDEPQTTTTGPLETPDRAQLPPNWQRHTNFDAGISLGLPPLWSARDRGIRTVVRSPDHLLAITVTADRTRDAIAVELDEFAARVAESLPGYESLDPRPPEPFPHRYPAVAINDGGRAEGGVTQDVLVVVFSRDGLVKVTALAAWNRAKTRFRDIRTARRILRTLRTRPLVS